MTTSVESIDVSMRGPRWGGGSGRRSSLLLREDPELAEAVPEPRRAKAEASSAALVAELATGTWDCRPEAARVRGGFGLLVLDGVLARRMGWEGRASAEILTAGDVLRPGDHEDQGGLPFASSWRVLAPARVGRLDREWAMRLAPFPEVGGELVGRALRRSRRLGLLLAVAQHPRLEEKLWLLFWELAGRCGVVRPDGTFIPLGLNHELLGHLVAARRPSVSSALARLAREGRVERREHGWLLHGEPGWAAR